MTIALVWMPPPNLILKLISCYKVVVWPGWNLWVTVSFTDASVGCRVGFVEGQFGFVWCRCPCWYMMPCTALGHRKVSLRALRPAPDVPLKLELEESEINKPLFFINHLEFSYRNRKWTETGTWVITNIFCLCKYATMNNFAHVFCIFEYVSSG